jgi:hypothetical protein
MHNVLFQTNFLKTILKNLEKSVDGSIHQMKVLFDSDFEQIIIQLIDDNGVQLVTTFY